LFAGPRAVGKTSTARILAKALNCKEGPTPNPCGRCAACLDITQGKALDVIEIDGASNRGIEEIRTLRESVKFAPTSGKFKVYIIDEVHQITVDGFNALLKTLEEPPPYVKFIFATTHPNKVMPTILSRCQRLDFRRISVMEIISQLEKIAGEEKIKLDKEVLFAIAKSSDGALRDAESILDQLFSFSKEKVSLKDVVSILGLVEQDALFELTDTIIRKDPKAALEILDRIIDDGKDTGVFLSSLIEHFRNLMIAKVSKGDPKLIDLPLEICERLLEQAHSMGLNEIFSAFNTLVATQEMTKRLDSLRIPLEICLVRLAYDKNNPGSGAIAKPDTTHTARRHKEEKKADEQIRQQEIRAEPPAQQHKPLTITLDNIKAAWQNLVEHLSRVKMSVATYLNEGEPLKLDGNTLIISFPKNYSLHKESLEKKEIKTLIEKTISEILNENILVNFTLTAQAKQGDDAREHPIVKSAMDMFGARLIKEE
ncbi:MAG: DNA polymerase III subunit gamma/tau, partial [Candidatus Omnitrophota bacterium]